MYANIALSHEGQFGESTSILDRCIFESCVNLDWFHVVLILKKNLIWYIASGLKAEIELKSQIELSINARNGTILNIEKRMLKSIKECLIEAGFDEEKIRDARRLPDLASRLDSLGHRRLSYTVGQRLGSHYVHGTWVALRNQYIEPGENGNYLARQATETHINQYIYIPCIIIEALKTFVSYILVSRQDETKVFLQLLEDTVEEISKLNSEITGSDYDEVSQ